MAATISQLKAEVVVEGADEAKRDIAAVGDEIDRQAKRSTSAADQTKRHDAALTKLGTGAMVAGGALLAGFGLAVGAAANFDKAMSGVGAVSNASAKDMDRLREAALKAGADTAFSASEAADAEAELAKAGVSTADILGGALKGSLDLAAAGQISVADAATISAQALNIFQLEGSDTAHVADLLAAGANKSAADVSQLGQALQQGGLLAKQTGLSLEDTVGALALFADNALIGSDAGTSLKTMLQRLTPQSAEAESKMRELGISAYDAQGQFVGLDKFAQKLKDSLAKLTPEQRNSALATIFGSDAVRGANILYEAGAKGVKEYTKAVNDQGAAGRMAGKQLDNLSGDLEQLRGSLETALITGGSGATGALRGMAQGATEAVNAFSALPAPIQSAATFTTALGGAALLVAGGIGSMAPKVREASDAMKLLATSAGLSEGSVSKAGTVLKGLAGVGVVIPVLTGLAVAIDTLVDDTLTGTLKIEGASKKSTQTLVANYLAQAKAVRDLAKDEREHRRYAIENKTGDLDRQNATNFRNLAEDNLATARRLYEGLKKNPEVAREYGISLNELGGMLDKETAAQKRANVDAQNAASLLDQGKNSAAGMAGAQGDVASETERAADALKEFKTAMDSVLGVHLSAVDADIKWRDTLQGIGNTVIEQVQAHGELGKTLDLNTEEGRRNQEAFNAAAEAAMGHAAAVAEETRNTKLGTVTLAGHASELVNAAKAYGLTDEQAARYVATALGIPPDIRSDIHTNADLQAALVRTLHGEVDALPPNKEILITVNAATRGLDAARRAISDVFGAFGWSGPTSASGNFFPRGGMSLVGEQGREIVELPAGARVINNATTERILAGVGAAPSSSGSAPAKQEIHLHVRAPLGTSPMRWARDLANGLEELSQFGGGNLGTRFANSDA